MDYLAEKACYHEIDLIFCSKSYLGRGKGVHISIALQDASRSL